MAEASQIGEEDSKKRHRESPPPPVVLESRTPLVRIYEKEFKKVEVELGLNVNFIDTFMDRLFYFVSKGMVKNINDLMRTDDSYKKSWDTVCMPEISCEELVSWGPISDSEADKVKEYLNTAVNSQFFDAPLPTERPGCVTNGFSLIYPEKQNQDDPAGYHEPMFEDYFSLPKITKFTEKLAEAAVAYHKCMTGSDLMFSKLKKAIMYSTAGSQYYFITLEATDPSSGKAITCKSRVRCAFYRDNHWVDLEKCDDKPVVVDDVFVQSFCVDE